MPSSSPSSSVVVDVRPRQSLRMDQMSAEVKQEAKVLARVKQLQQKGIWSEKRVPKGLAEPAQTRTHWGYMLEEMSWMASMFQVIGSPLSLLFQGFFK